MDTQAISNFVDAINAHDVDRICSLMTDDHTFVDSQGNAGRGKEHMRAGWAGYFQLFPDYKIEITEMFSNGETFAAFGFAGGTFRGLSDKKKNYWHLPASWKAVARNGKVQLWQVYADSKIPSDIVNSNTRP
jgi:ketosteroid isomerase-like protein